MITDSEIQTLTTIAHATLSAGRTVPAWIVEALNAAVHDAALHERTLADVLYALRRIEQEEAA